MWNYYNQLGANFGTKILTQKRFQHGMDTEDGITTEHRLVYKLICIIHRRGYSSYLFEYWTDQQHFRTGILT